MKTIVILENKIVELESLVGIFKQWQNEINILTAREEKAAINIISSRQVDLIVCNLSLPGKKELESLSRLTHSFPFVPCIAIASKGTGSSARAMEMGASRCLERPIDTVQLLDQVSELLELSSNGSVKGIPIHSFLQMLESEEKTCTLEIHGKEDTGFLYIKNGAIIGARTRDLRNEEAVYSILTWEEAVIEIRYLNALTRQEINTPLISLIVEAFRRKDERESREGTGQRGDKPRLQLKHVSTVGNRISLDIGSRIKMEFNDIDAVLASTLVGMLPDYHLIVTTPTPYSVVNEALKSNSRILVKYEYEGKLCMFKTQLLRAIDSPSHLLFLDYPQVIHYHEMRKAKRATIFVPCTLHPREGDELYGVLVDLSISGSLCLVKTKGNSPLPQMDIGEQLLLHCLLPGFKEEQEIRCIVRNIKKNSMETRVGLEFLNLQAYLIETIDRYLYSIEHLTN